MPTEAEKAAVARYKQKNIKQVKIELNRNTDADVIAHLEKQTNIRQYIIKLIKADMKGNE